MFSHVAVKKFDTPLCNSYNVVCRLLISGASDTHGELEDSRLWWTATTFQITPPAAGHTTLTAIQIWRRSTVKYPNNATTLFENLANALPT